MLGSLCPSLPHTRPQAKMTTSASGWDSCRHQANSPF